MASKEIKLIQNALAQKGFEPGVIDGVWGRRTEAAVRAFQQKNGLQIDGVVGPVTRAALLGAGIARLSRSVILRWYGLSKRSACWASRRIRPVTIL
jgi:murein L,D-transpeptidase YcbB/YkuD